MGTACHSKKRASANDRFTACQHLGLRVLRVDVAFSNYLGGQHQDKARDLVGTFTPGGMGPVGLPTVEILLTTPNQGHAKVTQKLQARIAAWAFAGAMFASRLLIMARYERGGGPSAWGAQEA